VKKLWQHRGIRFVVTATICTILQELILFGLIHQQVNRIWSDGIGFGLAAQANFILSSLLTWGDRNLSQLKRSVLVRWLKFNAFAGVVLLTNIGVFSIVDQYDKVLAKTLSGVWPGITNHIDMTVLLASLAGILAGALVSFNLNNRVTFRQSPLIDKLQALAGPIDTPENHDLARKLVKGKTLVYFLPAHDEGANLPIVVVEVINYLRTLDLREFRVIIINDGSQDDTAAVADNLALQHPEVIVYHHKANRGYGKALITGFRAAVDARTSAGQPYDLWAFSDSDRQFRIENLSLLLVAQSQAEADLVVGKRQQRESKFRYYLGRSWHVYSKTVVGRDLLVVSDVDCGMKMGRVSALATYVDKLFGEKAAISPELIARSKLAGHVIVEQTVDYLPRVAGKSTGSKPSVILISGFHILLVGIAIRVERRLGRTWQIAKRLNPDNFHEIDIFEGTVFRGE
jgi:putative flippase GtrA